MPVIILLVGFLFLIPISRIQLGDFLIKLTSKTIHGSVVEAARSGNHDAISAIYLTYQDQIYRYIYFRVGSAEVAQDLMQEVFLRMLESLSRYEERGFPISAWLYRIAYARCVDHVRRSRRHEALTLDHMNIATGEWEAQMFFWMEQNELRDALSQLTTEQQQVIILRFYQDMTVQETAQALGKTEGSVKALQHRGIKTLERIIGSRH
jgi:RNA polymerase sigma-70 factor (ECF subfamily)